jgi:5'-nucleotidase
MHQIKHTRTFLRAMTALAASSAFALGCSGPASDSGHLPAPDESHGTLSLKLSAGSGLAGFQIEIKASDGAPVSSKFLGLGDASGAEASEVFRLAPGKYTVTSTPMLTETDVEPACQPASHAVTIKRAKTSELLLASQCAGPASGAVDVEASANFAPELNAIQLEPGAQLAACEPVTLSFDASDVEGDALTCDVALDGGAENSVAAVAGDAPHSVHCVARLEPAAGEHSVRVRACDAEQCASLDIPLHVAAGACNTSCDDGNPCTLDSVSPEGFCSSSPVADGSLCTGGDFHVKLLGFNDFHGQLEKGKLVSGRPVGGAEVLASYLKAAQAGIESQTLLIHAGDQVGASPPASALLQDEPSIQFLNLLANSSCSALDKLNPACNIVGTLGNHEFDEGMNELLRLLSGGNYASGPFLEDPYPGARFPYVSANVIEHASGAPLLRPFVVKELHGIKVGVIGAVLKETPTIVTPTGVAGLEFLDEADAINAQVAALQALGVHTQIVTIHQGGFQTSYTGPTRAASLLTSGPEIQGIVSRLDDDVDVVISGHTHSFTNALLPNAHGKLILVVQAFSASTAYDDVDLLIDPATGDVTSKTAQVVTTYGDAGPGLTPDPAVAAVVKAATDRVAPLVTQVYGVAPSALSRNQNAAGESALGDLIADSQQAAQGSQFVFMNPGGIRADLDAGDVTFGDLFTIQPFGNTLVRLDMTGAQIVNVLEQQWLGQGSSPKMLQIAGFDYTWSSTAPVGSRIVEVRLGGVPIDLSATYSVTCNNFLATGGDNFTGFKAGLHQVGGAVDLDALIEYVREHTPLATPAGPRIIKL